MLIKTDTDGRIVATSPALEAEGKVLVLHPAPGAEFRFWAWAACASKRSDGTYAGIVKACYTKGGLFGAVERRDAAVQEGFASTGEALKWSRAKRRELNAAQPGIML